MEETHPIDGRPPSITEQSFSCPHCGSFTSQTWSEYQGRVLDHDSPVPPQYKLQEWEAIASKERDPEKRAAMDGVLEFVRLIEARKPFTEKLAPNARSPHFSLMNVHTSKCYVCKEMALWVHHRMVYPRASVGEKPHHDMPLQIRRDFEEARTILDQSPRGAAALLRLCVQKLCAHLGEKGKNIDDDIASLVRKGLAPAIQEALDAVRVIGNEAVHPGTMDLKDDRAIASDLLSIVNFIVDETITKPAKLRAIYKKLPADKLKGIEQRNAKALAAPRADLMPPEDADR